MPASARSIFLGILVDAYLAVTGRAPLVFPIPRFIPRILPKDLAAMPDWFANHGFQASIPELKREHPGLMSFAAWLGAR